MTSKDINEERVMHLKSNKIEIKIYDEVYEVIEELFQYPLTRYQIRLEKSMKAVS